MSETKRNIVKFEYRLNSIVIIDTFLNSNWYSGDSAYIQLLIYHVLDICTKCKKGYYTSLGFY
jgi:hypothetical protein